MSKGLRVYGMTCVECESIVEAALESLDGVTDADAYADRNAVKFEAGTSSPSLDSLLEAVENAGYEANVPESSE